MKHIAKILLTVILLVGIIYMVVNHKTKHNIIYILNYDVTR